MVERRLNLKQEAINAFYLISILLVFAVFFELFYFYKKGAMRNASPLFIKKEDNV